MKQNLVIMRRHDKKNHIAKANLLFEQRCNEERFSWDGTYANEVNEDDLKEEEIDEIVVGLGDDLEYVDEDCGCPLDQPEPTDVKKSQWFSDVDGERIIDKEVD